MSPSEPNRLPVPVAAVAQPAADAGFDAQRLGQGETRRGLRGGAPVLRGARAAYLSAQWRGEEDRRPSPGRLRRVEA